MEMSTGQEKENTSQNHIWGRKSVDLQFKSQPEFTGTGKKCGHKLLLTFMSGKNALNGEMYQKHNLIRSTFIPSDLGLRTSILKLEHRKTR